MYEKLDRNGGLIGEMAERVHADVARSIMLWDFMGANAWRSAMGRCSRCPASEECRSFLASGEGGEGRTSIPDFCANKAYLESLPETV